MSANVYIVDGVLQNMENFKTYVFHATKQTFAYKKLFLNKCTRFNSLKILVFYFGKPCQQLNIYYSVRWTLCLGLDSVTLLEVL